MAVQALGAFRIGGGGVHYESSDSMEGRVALVERYLRYEDRTIIARFKHDDNRSWQDWKADFSVSEFLHIGVCGEYGAAELVRSPPIRATHNPAPTGAEPAVLYDNHVGDSADHAGVEE